MQNLSDPGVIKSILSKHGFTFSKKLGQNFLINPSVCPKIAEMGGAKQGRGVIEIGPGIGVLTSELCMRADKVVAIELDKRLIPILSETLSEYKNLKVINADVMETDLKKLISEEFDGMETVICANLPYYITSPVVMKLLGDRLPVKSVTTMVQREAADRLCAPLGTRNAGAATVAVDFYSRSEKLFNVSRGSFMPSPQVDSSVIRLSVREDVPEVRDEKRFFRTVKGMFTQRRKTVLNALSGGCGIEKSAAEEILVSAGIALNLRPEQLKMEDFLRIDKAMDERG